MKNPWFCSTLRIRSRFCCGWLLWHGAVKLLQIVYKGVHAVYNVTKRSSPLRCPLSIEHLERSSTKIFTIMLVRNTKADYTLMCITHSNALTVSAAAFVMQYLGYSSSQPNAYIWVPRMLDDTLGKICFGVATQG